MAVKLHSERRFLTYINLTRHIVGLNISAAAEYRVSFATQIVGIIGNDITHILIWVIFFDRFTTLNGWQFHDMMLLLSVFMLSFGIFGIFTGGLIELAKYIVRGDLDYFLTFPKNVLWHTAVNRLEIPALGDATLAILVFVFLTGPLSLEKVAIYLLVSILSSLILINFTITTQSISFYLGNFEESADRWLWTLFGVALYPQTIFSGWLKVVTLTVLPSFFIIYLPVELLKHFNWEFLGILVAAVIFSSIISLTVFHKGLRRYESGNLINIRL